MVRLRLVTWSVMLVSALTLGLIGCGDDDDDMAAGAGGTSGTGGSTSTAGTGGSSAGTAGAGGSTAGAPGQSGPVSGEADAHCTGQPNGEVDYPNCHTTSGDGGDDGGDAGAAGAADCQQTHDPDYGDTRYGTEADDDDCKYHAVWSSTPIARNQDVTFTLTASLKSDGSALTGAPLANVALSRVELYEPCDLTHAPPAIDFKATTTETSPGVYTTGPYQFDAPGRWVVRFHFFEDCDDHDGSPHGHVAFFVDVP